MALYNDDYGERMPVANADVYWNGHLLYYGADKSLFYCSMDKRRSVTQWASAANANLISYGYNVIGLGCLSQKNPFTGAMETFSAKLSQIKNPAETLICVDSCRTQFPGKEGYYVAVPEAAVLTDFVTYARHGDSRSNLVLVDGHAKSMMTAELTAIDDASQSIPLNRYKYWSPIR
jgi:prepilin-type processing-associated H-X9-DG protein